MCRKYSRSLLSSVCAWLFGFPFVWEHSSVLGPKGEKNINSQRKGQSNIFAPKHLAFLVSVIWCALANKAPRWICPFRGDVILGLFCFNIAWESSHCFLEQISALKTTQRRNTHQDVILSHIVRGDTRWNIPSVNRCSTGGNLKRQYYSQF